MQQEETSTESGELWADAQPAAVRRILLAAIEAFAVRGYSAATTRDIADRVGMSPAAVYVHFRSKVDLLYEISRAGSQSALEAVERAVDGHEDPPDALGRYVAAFVSWHARNQTLARVIQYELKFLTPEQYDEVDGIRRRSERLLRGVLRRGATTGDFQIEDQRITVLAIQSLGIDVARWYARAPSPERLAARYADLALRMVAGPGTQSGNG
jgi:AcrR family transcriptional regulator